MQTDPLVSVIVNCFNGEKYLARALKSVEEQTYKHWELIIWDNRSTDSTAQICAKFKDPRIKYFLSSEHTNLGMARKRAAELASGAWICFLDCDDFWHPKKLERQLRYANALPDINIIYCHTKYIFDGAVTSRWARNLQKSGEKYQSVKPNEIGFYSLAYKNYIPLVSALFYRNAYEEIGGVDVSLSQAEDYDVILKLARRGSVYLVDEVLCYYCIHGNNLTQSQVELDHHECVKILSTFLPDPAISSAIDVRQAKFAVNLIRMGQVRKAFAHASVFQIFLVSISYLLRRIVR